jgi:Replication-relaxation
VRYAKGTIALSETGDYPLLRRVLHCRFVTSAQLYEFLKLDYCAFSRNAFDNRLRRLLSHGLVVRREIPAMSRGVVYAISPAGASEMIGKGEYYSGSTDKGEPSTGHVQHALELNDVHLALKRTGMLVRWTPESDIRSRNEFTNIGYVKDYDAVVSVRLDEHEQRFALEYERTPKAKRHYQAISKRIEAETGFRHFLYLVSNHDMLFFLVREFQDCRCPVHFGLRNDFLADTLGLTVQNNHSPVSATFRALLTAGSSRPSSRGNTTTTPPSSSQAQLFA